jgi:hypothetical protein
MVFRTWCYYIIVIDVVFLFNGYEAWTNPRQSARLGTSKLKGLARENVTVMSSPYTELPNDDYANTKSHSMQFSHIIKRKDELEMNHVMSRTEQNTDQAGNSEQRAIQQVSAIMDIYNSTRGDATISDQIVSKILEGLIQRVYQNREYADGKILEQLEGLCWRLDEFNISPTLSSLETLWMMQQRYSRQPHDYESPGKRIGRSVHLLMNWYSLSQRKDPNVSKPPYDYIFSTFSLARETNVTMSFRMWDLYELLYKNDAASLPREFYTIVKDIVSVSPGSWWKIRECSVLQDLERRHRATNNSTFRPSISELESALLVASRYGRAQEANWLFRMLVRILKGGKSTNSPNYLKLWFQAIGKSTEKGSATYMEQLLLSSQHYQQASGDVDVKLFALLRHRYYHNMVIQKWARAKSPGSGRRAKKIFERMVSDYRDGDAPYLRPNEESVHHVVMAYIREEPSSLQNLVDAHRFLRQSLLEFGSLQETATARHWRTFDNLLKAYSEYYSDKTAVAAVESLLRFFLVVLGGA